MHIYSFFEMLLLRSRGAIRTARCVRLPSYGPVSHRGRRGWKASHLLRIHFSMRAFRAPRRSGSSPQVAFVSCSIFVGLLMTRRAKLIVSQLIYLHGQSWRFFPTSRHQIDPADGETGYSSFVAYCVSKCNVGPFCFMSKLLLPISVSQTHVLSSFL